MKKILVTVLIVVFTVWLVLSVLPGSLERSLNVVEEHAPYVISPEAGALHESLFIVDR